MNTNIFCKRHILPFVTFHVANEVKYIMKKSFFFLPLLVIWSVPINLFPEQIQIQIFIIHNYIAISSFKKIAQRAASAQQ